MNHIIVANDNHQTIYSVFHFSVDFKVPKSKRSCIDHTVWSVLYGPYSIFYALSTWDCKIAESQFPWKFQDTSIYLVQFVLDCSCFEILSSQITINLAMSPALSFKLFLSGVESSEVALDLSFHLRYNHKSTVQTRFKVWFSIANRFSEFYEWVHYNRI